MTKISDDTVQAIKTAIDLEKKGYNYYKEAASKSDEGAGRNILLWLANEEIKHLKTFKAMFDSLADPQSWRGLVSQIPDPTPLPVFEKPKAGKEPFRAGAGEISVLRVALNNEREAISFFRESAADTEDPLAREIFNRVKAQEEYHYDLIQAEIDYIAETGFWFDSQEFRMDGKM